MNRILTGLAALLLVVACSDGNPFDEDETTEDPAEDTTDDGAPIAEGELPPGTASPAPDKSIFRREPFDAETGDGYANSFKYDAATDTFFVDGLAFDGDQPDGVAYTRATPGSLRGFALYEAPASFDDPISGNPIRQFEHRALYGVSASGETEFAIVRTGNYIEYGFGGFIYQRNGDVVLPAEQQATYRGDYAGLRDYNGRGGLEYVTGDMQVDIDFRGFRGNCDGTVCADAVRGYVSNRTIFDLNGNDLTQSYLDRLNDENTASLSAVPTIRFRIGPDVLNANGEIMGDAFSSFTNDNGDSIALDDGTYYAIMSGDHTNPTGGEIVGMVVVESGDPGSGATVRETGGFIVNR